MRLLRIGFKKERIRKVEYVWAGKRAYKVN